MKILYVANERSATQPVAAALRTLAPDVSLTWARDLSSALSWVHYNRDVAALVVEAELQKQSSASFIDHVRSLGLAAPVIVISQAGAPVLALKAGADDYVANDQSLATNLPSVVARALQRAQAIAHPSGKTALRLLYVGDAALARRCLENSRWAIELSEAERASDGTFQPIPPEAAADGALPFDVVLVDHDHPGVDTFAILKEIARRSLNVRVILVVEWDEKLAVPALKLGASDYVVKAADPFRALFCKLDPTRADVPLLSRRSTLVAEETVSREHLERQVREALAAAHETQRRFDTAAAHFRERESRLLAAIEEERDTRKTLEARLERERLDAAGVAEAGRIRSTLEAQLAEAKGALAQAEQQRALAAADAADNLAKRSAEFRATFAQALRAREAFKQQLSERTAELEAAKGALASEVSSTATRLAQREEELGTQIREAVVARKGLEQRVAELEATLEQSEQRRTLDAAASAARLTQREAELTASLAQAARSRDALEQQLREATEALAKARQERASESAAAADRLARREAELGATISEVTAARQALETQLTETEALRAQDAATRKVLEQALADADADRQATAERHASEIATARDHLAKRQALHHSALSEAATAAADQLSRREAELGATIAETVTTRDALVQKLADAEAALMAAREHAAAERAAAEVARQQAEQRHTSELSTAATLVTERQAQYDASLAEADLARGALERQVRDLTSALEESRQQLADAQAAFDDLEDHASEERLTAARDASQRQIAFDSLVREFDAKAAHAATARQAIEQKLADAEAALTATEQLRVEEAATAATQLTERLRLREAELGATIAEVTAARQALETQLTETEALRAQDAATRKVLEQALADADADRQATAERHASEIATARDHLAKRQALHDSALSEAATAAADQLSRREAELGATIEDGISARNALEQRVRDLTSALEESRQQLADAQAALAESGEERAALHESLGRTTEQFQQLSDAHDEARQIHERYRAASEAEHRRLSAEYASLQETFAGLRTQFEALERVSAEHAAERDRLAGVVTEREAQLREQGATHQASQQAANQAMSLIEEKLRQALEASGREAVRFQNELSALGQELDVTRRDRDSLRTQADRLPQLQTECDESRADNQRLFEHSPFGQFRCNRDGTLKRINRAFVGLLGYRTGDELQKVDCAKTVFESEDDLHWLIERCFNSGTAETVETTWRKKDGHRIVVKLTGVAASPDTIDIVAEDITESRELEERLRQAHRMEAVGRLASEVAVTCDNLLRDVSQDGQQWLAAMHDDTVLRRRGELLLGEVTRAASFLRQLSVYGHKQTTLGPVNLQRLLHDLGPVLKSVAGDDIELVLPKASPAVNVDVESERVERVLVNVASYARERMPHGGRLNIELATVVVDRRFVAKYPNVRPGDHVLITITEVTDTVTTSLPAALPDDGTAAASRSTIEKPGVDLGALLSLVGDCGGHLWMSAEPPGNMVLKIHLPRLASDGQQIPHTPVARLDRGRSKARWFRN